MNQWRAQQAAHHRRQHSTAASTWMRAQCQGSRVFTRNKSMCVAQHSRHAAQQAATSRTQHSPFDWQWFPASSL
jgi:hypothetical protein